jgi:hypothetical protein
MPADIVAYDSGKSPEIQSRVSVEKLANGDVSYTETVHWVGQNPDPTHSALKSLNTMWTNALPARLKTSDSGSKLSGELLKIVSQAMYGPPYPYLFDAATTPDLLDLELADGLRGKLEDPIKQAFPDITADERQEFFANLTKVDTKSLGDMKPPQPNPSGPDMNQAARTDFLFVVKPPGAVVETNGLTMHDGHVYWSLSKESVEFGDAVLRLTAHSGGTQ